MYKQKTIFLVLTACIVIGGDICRPKSVVEVTEGEARDLLHRRKARLATEKDLPEGVTLDSDGDQDAQDDATGGETAEADTGAPEKPENAPEAASAAQKSTRNKK